ncbi:MAG: SIS domain-containing protein [Candidatus Delongbacteria bacterium]|nr:SIS domain-containing protein [Candidatus Delongbacteria bacterium]
MFHRPHTTSRPATWPWVILAFVANLRIPIPGIRSALGCGVLGLIYAKRTERLGSVAVRLLRALEYRGYDSTGGAFQDGTEVTLLKAPGAPSKICGPLGMQAQAGRIFCGQVRWATYGAVDQANSQPHDVHCHTHIYGAHNGNISNSPRLKHWLKEQGHEVLSDNDGEMLVHTVEHFFSEAVAGGRFPDENAAMRHAIVLACEVLTGSYAAIIVNPRTETVWAIKRGSSLYVGIGSEGENRDGNAFILASSDLTAVLRMTRLLLPIREGQFVEFTADSYTVFAAGDQPAREGQQPSSRVRAGSEIAMTPRFSNLQVDEIGLRDGFQYFMEQEIVDEIDSARRLVRFFTFGSGRLRQYRLASESHQTMQPESEKGIGDLMLCDSTDALMQACGALFDDDPLWENFQSLPAGIWKDETFYSDSAPLLRWAWERHAEHPRRDLLKLADLYLENDEINDLNTKLMQFVQEALACHRRGGQIYAVSSGTSYNAARTGALFFNDLCGVKFIPLLPGEYRSQFNHCITERDLLLTISQSGETKDVIDVVNDLKTKCPRLHHISLVNNMNSTLAQEKADLAIPLRCGPEIAVPATKSYINQNTMLLGMAKYLSAALGGRGGRGLHGSVDHESRLDPIPDLLHQTLKTTGDAVSEIAGLLYLVPSLHILGTRMWGVAREGALKIREVVLNHAEGISTTEFKHGPNTILGLNNSYGLDQMQNWTRTLLSSLASMEGWEKLDSNQRRAQLLAFGDSLFTGDILSRSPRVAEELHASLYKDYPLIYITGPGQRDVDLTITQINTHKIRGAMTIVIAEPNEDLRRAALDAPGGNPNYVGRFVALPPTGDLLYTTFSSILVLQRLAYEMCLMKMAWLERMGFRNHGVHPDSPKNVSKSITVD